MHCHSKRPRFDLLLLEMTCAFFAPCEYRGRTSSSPDLADQRKGRRWCVMVGARPWVESTIFFGISTNRSPPVSWGESSGQTLQHLRVAKKHVQSSLTPFRALPCRPSLAFSLGWVQKKPSWKTADVAMIGTWTSMAFACWRHLETSRSARNIPSLTRSMNQSRRTRFLFSVTCWMFE